MVFLGTNAERSKSFEDAREHKPTEDKPTKRKEGNNDDVLASKLEVVARTDQLDNKDIGRLAVPDYNNVNPYPSAPFTTEQEGQVTISRHRSTAPTSTNYRSAKVWETPADED